MNKTIKLKFLYQKAQRRLKKRPPLIDKGDYKQTLFLAGCGRSGTTWVMQILNYKNEYRILYEPFHSLYVDILSHFRYRQYLRPENNEPAFLKPVETILSGQIRNKWIDKANRRLISKKRLLKEIRANLFLKWIKTHFPEIPVIMLLRHPCAVAASRIKLNWDSHLEEFLAQKELMDDFLNPFKSEIENAQTDFEKYILLWCIENYVPLIQFSPGEINICFYENFCICPEKEIDVLFSFLGKTYTSKIYRVAKIPSGTARKRSATYSQEKPAESYKKSITPEQIQRAIQILKVFGLDKIYGPEPMPPMDRTKVFLEAQ